MKIDGTRAHDRATELVLAYYAAFNRGDWAGMQALLAEDVVHDLNQGPREAGKPAFAAFQQRMARSYREQLRDVVVLASPDGLRGSLGAINFALLRTADAQVLTADDARTVAAMRLLWTRTKQLVEPSSAIALAAVAAYRGKFEGRKVGIILSGGNVDLDALPALFATGDAP